MPVRRRMGCISTLFLNRMGQMVFPLGPDRRDALSYVGSGAARHVGLASRLPNHKNRVEMHPGRAALPRGWGGRAQRVPA